MPDAINLTALPPAVQAQVRILRSNGYQAYVRRSFSPHHWDVTTEEREGWALVVRDGKQSKEWQELEERLNNGRG